ncbi:MAG: class I SAM-dependent methyltransferase [Gammaproteobacteria bacterium]
MNQAHLELLTSEDWADWVANDLIPRALPSVELGDHLIEIGSGPGKTTDVLRHKVDRLTAVELDPVLTAGLAERLAGTNVEVVNADATQLPFQDASFSAASSFTMLHHVHSSELQDRLLAEVARVLKPGGVFFGADSLDSPEMREFHIGDVLVPVDPFTFSDRLRQAGFVDVTLATAEWDLCFTAIRS